MTGQTAGQAGQAGRRRWPLLVIGASAGVAVWSGWVGLGGMTGFGVVRPLPGIWDSLTIDTAITLPIGVEAYGVYALSVATDPAPLPARVRRVAWASAGGALGLGAGAQVAYHLMAAQGVTQAPWWVIAIVAVLPVFVLGAASLLWHLRSAADVEAAERETVAREEAAERAARRAADRERRAQEQPAAAPVAAPVVPAAAAAPVRERKPAGRATGDVRELLPVAREVAAELQRGGRPVARRALLEGLRAKGLTCSTERAGALLALLEDHDDDETDDESGRPGRLLASA